jgi:hypothetical protein
LQGSLDHHRLHLTRTRGEISIRIQLSEPLPWELMSAYGGTANLRAENVHVFGDRLTTTITLTTADLLINRVRRLGMLASEAQQFHAVLAQKIQHRTLPAYPLEERAAALRALHTHFPHAQETQSAFASAAHDADPAYRLAAATTREDDHALRKIAGDRTVHGKLRVRALLLVERAAKQHLEAQNILLEILGADELSAVEAASALGSIGTHSAIAALVDARAHAEDESELARTIDHSLRVIRERHRGGTPGSLSLASIDGGAVSIAPAESGALSPADPDKY